MNERISRRDAVKAIGAFAAVDLALYLGYNFGDEVYVTLRYLEAYQRGKKESGVSPLAEIENNISIDESLNNEHRIANKSAFTLAAVVVAMHQDPKYGLSNLNTFLRKFPLTITAPTAETRLLDDPAENDNSRLAYYQPMYVGGPKIVFLPAFFDLARHSRFWVDPSMQLQADTHVYHEFFHLMQDIKDPFAFSSKYPDLSTGEVNYEDIPYEIEAYRESEEIVAAEFQKVLDSKVSFWPFGQFFDFK